MFSHHCEELDPHNYTVHAVPSNSTGILNDYYGPLHKGKILGARTLLSPALAQHTLLDNFPHQPHF